LFQRHFSALKDASLVADTLQGATWQVVLQLEDGPPNDITQEYSYPSIIQVEPACKIILGFKPT
jgi:hypothetical protein